MDKTPQKTLPELITSVVDANARAQLILQEQQLELAQSELSLKREQLIADQKHKISPVTTAALAAGAALLSAIVTSTTTQLIETRKFELAQTEFEYGLIKEALTAATPEERKERLWFLMNAGLLGSRDHDRRLRELLEHSANVPPLPETKRN